MVVLGVACLVVFFSGPGQTYGVSTFVDPMIGELEISRSLYSTAYSFGTLMSAGALVIIGRQIDRWGEQKVLVLASAGFVVALLLLSAAQGPLWLFIGFALLRTCGSGVLTLAARTLIPHWFVRRRGWAFSMIGLASAVSLALFPLLHSQTVQALGWRGAWRLDAVLLLVLLLPAVIFFIRNRPADVGYVVDRRDQDAQDEHPAAHIQDEPGLTLREAMRTPFFWAIVGASVVPSLVVTGLAFNQVAIFTDRGLPETLTATTFTVESVFQVLATLGVGWFVDRYPVKYSLAGGQVALALAMICLIFATGPALSYAYAALRGASSALWMISADVAWPLFYGRRHLGSIRGVGFSLGVVGAAIGPLPFGFAYDAFGNYSIAITALLILPVIATVALLLVKTPEKISHNTTALAE